MDSLEAQMLAEKLLEVSPLVGVLNVPCPVPVNLFDCSRVMPIDAVIVHLNDEHHLTREEIADWLDEVSIEIGFELKIYAQDDPECELLSNFLYHFRRNNPCPMSPCGYDTLKSRSLRSLIAHLKMRHLWDYGKVNNWVITQVKERLYEQG